MIAKDVISRVRTILKDSTSFERWSENELFAWLQDAVDEIGNVKPDETTELLTIELDNNNRQRLPQTIRQLVRLERNVDGLRINKADRYALTSCENLYHPLNESSEIYDYWQDSASSREYWVYPKPRSGVRIEGYFSLYQPEINNLDDQLRIQPAYRMALVDYVLYRAYSKDAEYADNARLASMYAEAFTNKTGIRIQGKESNIPVTHYDRRRTE